jgi:hypothetical protein
MDKKQAGSLGGRAKNPNKGFGSLTLEERKERGRKAALKRWRKNDKAN